MRNRRCGPMLPVLPACGFPSRVPGAGDPSPPGPAAATAGCFPLPMSFSLSTFAWFFLFLSSESLSESNPRISPRTSKRLLSRFLTGGGLGPPAATVAAAVCAPAAGRAAISPDPRDPPKMGSSPSPLTALPEEDFRLDDLLLGLAGGFGRVISLAQTLVPPKLNMDVDRAKSEL